MRCCETGQGCEELKEKVGDSSDSRLKLNIAVKLTYTALHQHCSAFAAEFLFFS